MPPRILIVDDSLMMRLGVAMALQPFECVVEQCCNGEQGLAAARAQKPNAIILDISMPVMDGVTMLGLVREDAELKSVPVIMLTAETSRAHVRSVANLGIRDYLLKPFKAELLIEKLGRVVTLARKTCNSAVAA